MVKENLYNMLGPCSGARVLDAFAGGGSLGIEAVSRGATQADFIEHDRTAFRVLETNLKNLEIKDRCTAYKADALRQLRRLETEYDLIMLDPPYYKGLIEKALATIDEKKLLTKSGRIVLLYGSEESIAVPTSFTTLKTRTYGVTAVTLLKRSE